MSWGGVIIDPRRDVAVAFLDKIGESLISQGLTLDDLIESGRAERGDLLREMYGIESSTTDGPATRNSTRSSGPD